MCGRFYVEDDEALEDRIRRLNRDLTPRTGDICPGDGANVLFRDSALRAACMQWGFDRTGGGLVINARSESAGNKAMFSELFKANRLLIPAHAYYEWDAGKVKHTLGIDAPMYLAGLYRPRDRRFVVLTREAAPMIRPIHPRMPVIFTSRAAREWLKSENDPNRVLASCETETVYPMHVQTRLEV